MWIVQIINVFICQSESFSGPNRMIVTKNNMVQNGIKTIKSGQIMIQNGIIYGATW